MIKQSKLSKICWAFVYLLPLIYAGFLLFGNPDSWLASYITDVFYDIGLPYLDIQLFISPPLSDLMTTETALFLDRYLGYLVLVCVFSIIWRVLVYLPDVVGKLIDRWSL